jgi:DNA repair protein RecN (Recombination protein N)
MLEKLHIKNFAIIEEITLEFKNNLSVITGETGAGKSILLGALELILGKRAQHSDILNKEEKCTVEATFSIAKNASVNELLIGNDIEVYSDLIIRREINANGRSRSFLNDTPVKLELLILAGNHIVDMHRQFDNYELLQQDEQLKLIDTFLQLNEERSNYQNSFNQYQKVSKLLEENKEDTKRAKSEQDYLEFVWQELNELPLADNNIEDWTNELELLENAQNIKATLHQSANILQHNEQSLISSLQQISKETGQFANLSEDINSIQSRLLSSIEELKDIAAEIEIQQSSINTDEEHLRKLSDKLELANKLLHKHNAQSTVELLEIKQQFQLKLEKINNSDTALNRLTEQKTLLENKCDSEAKKLSKKRVKGILRFSKEINDLLPNLGFVNASFEIQHSFTETRLNGIDEISFLFDANGIGKLTELRKSISGGEMSRIMLAIKSLLAHSSDMPCMIFDEIDTGISGETALKIGGVIKELAKKHQVICISHLPQIAAKANQHLYIFKESDNTIQQTKAKYLTAGEKVEAIAKMLSGKNNSQSAILAAKELLGDN